MNERTGGRADVGAPLLMRRGRPAVDKGAPQEHGEQIAIGVDGPALTCGEAFERLGEHEAPQQVGGRVDGPRLRQPALGRESSGDVAAGVVPAGEALLDRPGTGLSAANPLADPVAIRGESATLVPDVLDALGIERAHLVGSSHGGYVALLAGALHPERVDRIAVLGCPAFVPGMRVTASDRVALLPGARHLFVLARPSEKALRKILGQLGHSTSLAAGRVPQALVDWCVALQRDTPTMRNEFATMSAMGTFRSGFHPALMIGPDTLAQVRSSTYFLWGSDEVYGDESVARRTASAMPDAGVEIMQGAGHLCWLDDVDHASTVVRGHLGARDLAAP